MASAREEDLFLAWRRRPAADTLAALLRGHQDHVYNICFQVLRHPEDAEDVSQEVLVETARGAGKIEAPRAFKAWLYRVALHASLKLKEARARRVELAKQLAARPAPGDAPMDPEERAALMRAIGDLDDPTRCLVLEHYFDKLTLEEIGAREGVSSVAIWKRLDRAKDQLRKALVILPALDTITPVAAPPSLAATIGGIAMGIKTAITAGGVVAALLLLGATAGGGYAVGTKFRAPAPVAPVAEMRATPRPVEVATAKSAAAAPEVRVADSEPEPDWNAVAQEAFELLTHVRTSRLTYSKPQWEEMKARLNEKTGAWFAKKYREAIDATNAAIAKEDPRWDTPFNNLSAAMQLCGLSGGPEVSALLLERLTADKRPQWEFGNLSMLLGGISGWYPWDKIPVTAAHHDAALKLAQSSNEEDFRCAIGVLGRFDTPEARRFLTETFQSHPSAVMRMTAAHALGGAGDASTLKILKMAASGADERMGKLIAESIKRLEAKFR